MYWFIGALPELSFLSQLLRQRFMSMKRRSVSLLSFLRSEELYRIVGIFFKGVRACLVIHNVQLTYIIGLPMINIATFITFIYSLREMILDANTIHNFYDGGLLWFENLQDKDSSFLLPFLSLSLSYLALEISFSKISSPTTASGVVSGSSSGIGSTTTAPGRFLLFFKDFFQSIVVLTIPLVIPLPSGIFCYWIPNSLLSISQILLMRTAWFRRVLRIPMSPLPPHLNPVSNPSETKNMLSSASQKLDK